MNCKSQELPYAVIGKKKDLYEDIFQKFSTILNNPSLGGKVWHNWSSQFI